MSWCSRLGKQNTFNVDDVGYATAAAAGLDGGTITPTGASIGTKQGFSIIQWEGTNNIKTISYASHKLPNLSSIRILTQAVIGMLDLHILAQEIGCHIWYLVLQESFNNSDVWQQGGVPNATTFGVGAVGNSTGTHIAYLWHSVPGFKVW